MGIIRSYLALSLPLLLLAALTCLDGCNRQQDNPSPQPADDSLVLVMVATDSISVLDLTRQHYDVKSRSTAIGAFVIAIDSIENSLDAYWIYSVNDSTPAVASDKLIAAPGDTVRWHYRRTRP